MTATSRARTRPRQLHDALALVLGRADDPNFSRACARWVSNYVQLTRWDALEADIVRACLPAAAGDRDNSPATRQTLLELVELRELVRCADVLRETAGAARAAWPSFAT